MYLIKRSYIPSWKLFSITGECLSSNIFKQCILKFQRQSPDVPAYMDCLKEFFVFIESVIAASRRAEKSKVARDHTSRP